MVTIKGIKAREILDSRGNPTVEVDIWSAKHRARAAVPSGASTGAHEALELRDQDKRFHGKGVHKAMGSVNTLIGKKIVGSSFAGQEELDQALIDLDGTADKSNLGANALLGVSLAHSRLAALHAGVPLYAHLAAMFKPSRTGRLPVPFSNVINGGQHAGNDLAVQEFMIAPTGAKSFAEGIRAVSEVYQELKGLLKESFGKAAINVGDEGGFAPPFENTEDAILIIIDAIDNAGYSNMFKLAMDAAATEFHRDGLYGIDGKEMDTEELHNFYLQLCDDYPFISIEDPFQEEDFSAFAALLDASEPHVQIVGDDLLVTNPARIDQGIQQESCNSLLLKVNQIGTLSEALEAAHLVMGKEWSVMVSHRSGETEDTFIADLAVGIGSGQIKTGAPARAERTAKYNRLLRIEEELGKKASYGL